MLTGVVDEHGATGNAAAIPGYTVAGKTGTAQKPGPNGVHDRASTSRRSSAWCRSRSRGSSCSSTVDEPHGAIFGGVVAAPAFAQIAKFDLQYLGVPPDLAATLTPSPGARHRASFPRDAPRPSDRGARPDRGRERGVRSRSPTSPTTRAPSRPGALFFCVPGRRVDGHDLAGDAVARGAAALVVERVVDAPCRSSSSRACARRCRPPPSRFFGDPSRELDVAAVTGTNGKTTTAFLLARDPRRGRPPARAADEHRAPRRRRAAADGLNTPESIDLQRLFREMLDAGDRSCVMEATSIAAAKGRLGGTRFAVLVFTNLTQDHLDFHGTMEEYFAAKRALFDAGRARGRERRRRVGRAARGRAAASARTFTPDDDLDGDRPRAARPLQPRERARCRRGGARARRRRGGDPRRASRRSPACPAGSSRSRRGSRSR